MKQTCPRVAGRDRVRSGSMGSAASELPHDVLVGILQRLSTREQLLGAASVSRAWLAAASDAAVMRRVMAAELGVIDIIVDAECGDAWLGPIAGEMAMVEASCAVPPRVQPLSVARRVRVEGATLAMLAVKYGTSPGEIKRLNGFASEMAFQCRRQLLVPVSGSSPKGLFLARYEHDDECQRSLFVLYTLSEYYAMLAGVEEGTSTRNVAIQLNSANARFAKQLAISSLKRQMAACGQAGSFDDDAAAYYLEASSGDIKEALKMAREDERWELERRRAV